MSERTVGIYPQTRYDFLPNATYHVPWNFLPYERAKVIAEHLTYLAFHEWLMDNLRHATQHEPEPPDWSRLGLSVAEGFFKTDVLLYASICEAALYTALHLVHSHEGARAHQAVKDCFRTIEDRFHKISSYKASMNIQGNVTGDLCLHLTREEQFVGAVGLADCLTHLRHGRKYVLVVLTRLLDLIVIRNRVNPVGAHDRVNHRAHQRERRPV
jgi:hypothetical protein